MQQKKTQIEKADEALRILWLEETANASESDTADEQVNRVLQEPVQSVMPEDKESELIARLFEKLSTVSLGVLVTEKIRSLQVPVKELAADSGLTESRIGQIAADELYPHSVPVMLLKNFLEKLGIAFNLAERGIYKTFEMVQQRMQVSNVVTKPVFRRSMSLEQHDGDDTSKRASTGMYNNREALHTYLNKLEELMARD